MVTINYNVIAPFKITFNIINNFVNIKFFVTFNIKIWFYKIVFTYQFIEIIFIVSYNINNIYYRTNISIFKVIFRYTKFFIFNKFFWFNPHVNFLFKKIYLLNRKSTTFN